MAGRPGRSTPQPAARKGKPAGRKPNRPTVLGRVFARPGVIVAGATFAAVMTGIVANALLLQKGHHPSPLFSPAPPEATAAAPSAPTVPLPPPAPRQAVAADPAPPAATEPPVQADIAPAPAAAPAAIHTTKKPMAHTAVPHAAVTHKAPAPVHQDLIGQLLGKQAR
jgi:hypothetical protein